MSNSPDSYLTTWSSCCETFLSPTHISWRIASSCDPYEPRSGHIQLVGSILHRDVVSQTELRRSEGLGCNPDVPSSGLGLKQLRHDLPAYSPMIPKQHIAKVVQGGKAPRHLWSLRAQPRTGCITTVRELARRGKA